MRITNTFRKITASIIAALFIIAPCACAETNGTDGTNASDNKPTVLYSDDNYRLELLEIVRTEGASQATECVSLHLSLRNDSGRDVIFSSVVCVDAIALPSGSECAISTAEADATLDGIIHSGDTADGWISLEIEAESESIQADFYTSYAEGESISFNCKL